MEAALLAWFDEHARDLPWRRTRDPYAILVSEVMLQQTQVARVVPRYLAFLERWPTVESLAAAAPGDVIREWQGLGYNRRALNLHRAARHVAAEGWPDDLTDLPGVGRYTADAVARFALDRPVLPVDTNVRRVLERTGGEFGPASAHALMDLGATVCLARIPRCDACPLAKDLPVQGPALRAASQAESLRGLVPPAPCQDADARSGTTAAAERSRLRGARVAGRGRARRGSARPRHLARLTIRTPLRPVSTSASPEGRAYIPPPAPRSESWWHANLGSACAPEGALRVFAADWARIHGLVTVLAGMIRR